MFAFLLTGATAVVAADRPPVPPRVQTAKDAIAVAQAQFSLSHALQAADHFLAQKPMGPVKDLDFWQKNFTANYAKGVWYVVSKARYAEGLARVEVDLTAQEGKVVASRACSKDCPPLPKNLAAPVGPWAAPPNG
jgi:hypothetical protein